MAVKQHTVGDQFRIFSAHDFYRSKFLVISAHGTRLRNAQQTGLSFAPKPLAPGAALPLFVFLTQEGYVQGDVGMGNLFEVLQTKAILRMNPQAKLPRRYGKDSFIEVWDPNDTGQIPDYRISKYQGAHSNEVETYESIKAVLGSLDDAPRQRGGLTGREQVEAAVRVMLSSVYAEEPEQMNAVRQRIWPGREARVPGGEYFDVGTVRNREPLFGARQVNTLSSFMDGLAQAGGVAKHAWMLQYRVIFCFFCRGAERAEAR